MGEGNMNTKMRFFLQKGILRNMLLSILETLLYRDKEVEIKFVSLVLAYLACVDF